MRFTKKLFTEYVIAHKDTYEEDLKKYGAEDTLWEILDEMSCGGEFLIPARFCADRWNVEDDEAFEYFEYLNNKLNLVQYLKELLSK